jgi:hypothetical protein
MLKKINYLSSLGLVTAPRIRFLKNKSSANVKKKQETNSEDDEKDEYIQDHVPEEVVIEKKPNESFNFMRNDDNFSFKVKPTNKKKESEPESQDEVF